MNTPEAKNAGLTKEEVLSIRLYTSQMYKVINMWLRGLNKGNREQLLSKEQTWAQTIVHACQGFNKLGQIGTQTQEGQKLERSDTVKKFSDIQKRQPVEVWRGMNGQLPKNFFIPDD